MSSEIFLDKVENLLSQPERISVNRPSGGVAEFHKPNALFFGEESEFFNDYEVSTDTFSLNRDLEPLINGIFLHLAAGLNVQLKINGANSQMVLKLMRILDHTYALLVQACAADPDKPPNGLSCGLFYIVLEDKSLSKTLEDRSSVVASGLMGGVKSALEQMVRGGVNMGICQEMLEVISQDLKVMLPFVAARVFFKREAKDSYFKYPSVLNFDTYMGGALGWVRLEQVLGHTVLGYELNIDQELRQECLDVLRGKVDRSEELIYKTGDLLKDGMSDKLNEMVKEVRHLYNL